MEPNNSQVSPIVPISIIVGFALVALAIFMSGGRDTPLQALIEKTPGDVLTDKVLRTVTEEDFILGNPNAPILVIVYSDYECPFCKRFHTVMNQVMDNFGVGGKVAWVYRQFPLVDIHPNAAKIAETALCVGHVGGNSAFWKFTNLIYDSRGVTDFTNVTKITDYIESVGVSLKDHEACLKNGTMREHLEIELADAYDAGVDGTPTTFVIVGSQQAILKGDQSYEMMSSTIKNLIEQLDGEFDPATATSTSDTVIPVNTYGVPVVE
jgi:protein-disulfide isomerase